MLQIKGLRNSIGRGTQSRSRIILKGPKDLHISRQDRKISIKRTKSQGISVRNDQTQDKLKGEETDLGMINI